MSKDYFKVPHNKHLGKKPKDWEFPKYSKEKYGKHYQMADRRAERMVLVFNNNRLVENIPKS